MTEETRKKEPHAEKPLEKMTVKELREIAVNLPHVQAVHDMKKEEIIAFIREARGIRDEMPARKKKKVVKLKMTRPELKARIRELKGLKIQAGEEKDGKKLALLRRRISRLKKKSRKAAGA
ncbi:MAG: transcription termination factor Rho [Deltaproteobacteria bacterium]|nr:transcription termination factor Rho [Deltaproteobacteria bacterium]